MTTPSRKVLLLGLDSALASDLSRQLANRGFEVLQAPTVDSAVFQSDLVFVETNNPDLNALIRLSQKPVIVVSRLPEVDDWLDAMDSGASDYFAAPFDSRQLDWILETNLGQSSCLVAAHASAA